MKLSFNWLCDFLDIKKFTVEDLAAKLTSCAFEVEDITQSGTIIDNKIVLGQIKDIAKHPDADKLQITQTCVGKETLQIVCGAKNIKVGQKVPVALIGAEVNSRENNSKFIIKHSKIRGIESHGMLCSAEELGLKNQNNEGIYILDDIAGDHALGTNINSVLGLNSDFILEVGARSNRGDALSVLGQARELAAITEVKLQNPFNEKVLEAIIDFDPSVKSIRPQITNPQDCVLFYTISLENLIIKESPQWIQERINSMGIKSINNIVDVSNYVLLEFGQPMHFYDRDKISGDSLVVRRAAQQESLTTLENKTHKLEEINLVIADKDEPLSLAGVMGGLASSITNETRNIVIEVAVFNPAIIRKSSRAAGVESESKRRFERGVDKSLSKLALLRAVKLLIEVASPENNKIRIGQIHTAGKEDTENKEITLLVSEVERHLGINLEANEIINLLSRLNFHCLLKSSDSLVFNIPSYRQNDITRPIDLIEEVGRLYGFDNIPASRPTTMVNHSRSNEKEEVIKKVLQTFIAAGFSEIKLSSLIGDSLEGLEKQFLFLQEQALESISMDNPLSCEHRVLRQSLLPGLIQAASRNYAYDKSSNIKLFEIGKIYGFKNETKKNPLENCKEEEKIAAIMIINEEDWTQKKPSTISENFFKFKTVLENMFDKFFLQSFDSLENDSIHPGIAAQIIYRNKTIGIIGKLHPILQKKWDLPEESYILEVSLPSKSTIKFSPIINTPIIERDLTVDTDKETNCQDILGLIQKNTSKDLQKIKITSLFLRDDSDPKPKSTTFRLKWQSEQTLTGEEIDKQVNNLKSLLEKEMGARFRA